MGKLDDELHEAIAAANGSEAPDAHFTMHSHAGPAQPAARKSIGLLLTLLAVTLALVALFLFGFKEAAIYAMPVDELAAATSKYEGRRVRVEGELVPGSLVKRDQPCEYRFRLRGGDHQVPIQYRQCVVPDTFRDVPTGGVQVTVEGTLRGSVFDASLVMAKCTSKYDPSTHELKPSVM